MTGTRKRPATRDAGGAENRTGQRNDARTAGAGQAGRGARTDKAAFVFAFLRSVKRCEGLARIDAAAALDLIEWADDQLTFYRSAAALGRAIRCAESTAEAALSRLVATGHLVKLPTPKGAATPQGGRLARRFRLAIPAEVSTDAPVETPDHVSTDGPVETSTRERGVSTDQPVMVSTDGPVTISLEDSLKGAGAHSARPAPIPLEGQKEQDSESESRSLSRGRALSAPARTGTDMIQETEAEVLEEPAADLNRGQPIDLADLDHLAALERAAEESRRRAEADDDDEGLGYIDRAQAALAAVYGARVDAGAHVASILDAADGDDAALSMVAAALAQAGPNLARHGAIVRALVSDARPETAEMTLRALAQRLRQHRLARRMSTAESIDA